MSEIPHEKPLKRSRTPRLYHVVDGVKVPGPNQKMHGDCSELWGDCSGLRGDCTGLEGNLSLIPTELRKQRPGLEHWINAEETA